MKLRSKFRTLYLIRINIIFVLFSFIALSMFNNDYGIYEIIIVRFLLLTFGVICQLFFLSSVNTIIVLENGLSINSIILKKTEFYLFSSITEIQNYHVQGSYGKTGQITSGYFESELFFNDGKTLKISPDCFENYGELITFIRSKVIL
ncbi:hypothetical protein ACFFLS_06990 [Flavobacterium procerum]|uniref:Bacterial Pleckstrin homology domain-containing protein n=1 Tax=Flavobacterium procerum TaxID=1455569 RepID=A0ABV6BMU5_9FLAO